MGVWGVSRCASTLRPAPTARLWCVLQTSESVPCLHRCRQRRLLQHRPPRPLAEGAGESRLAQRRTGARRTHGHRSMAQGARRRGRPLAAAARESYRSPRPASRCSPGAPAHTRTAERRRAQSRGACMSSARQCQARRPRECTPHLHPRGAKAPHLDQHVPRQVREAHAADDLNLLVHSSPSRRRQGGPVGDELGKTPVTVTQAFRPRLGPGP